MNFPREFGIFSNIGPEHSSEGSLGSNTQMCWTIKGSNQGLNLGCDFFKTKQGP
jgi:hypothetical protein